MHEINGADITGYKFADLHMHTTGSLDVRRRTTGLTPQEAVLSGVEAGLSALAITDHDNLLSSYEAWNFAEKEGLPIELIPGVEITTRDGHLIGLYLTSSIPSGLSIAESVRSIHTQSGLAILPHPGHKHALTGRKSSLFFEELEQLQAEGDPDVYFDGVELYSTGVVDASRRHKSYVDTNQRTQELYCGNSYRLGAQIGSSDGHRMTVGRGLTAYKGELIDAIKNKETMAVEMDFEDNRRLVINAVRLFGSERVLGGMTLEQFEKRVRWQPHPSSEPLQG